MRQEREKRGLTIEQVASATKIGVRILHLLEENHYTELPAKPFIRGFVTSYARFVGLDPHEVLTRFNDFIEQKAMDRPNRDAGHSGYAFEKREGEQSRTLLWIVLGGFIVVGALIVIFLKPSFKRHRGAPLDKLRAAHGEPSPSASPSPESIPSELAASASPTVAASLSPSPTPSAIASAALAPSPSVSPKASPSPSPKPRPSPSLTPSPKPSVGPSPSARPSPSASPSSVAEKPDPLNSGVNLKSEEIKYKVIFRAKADLWVRFQVDDRPQMKFILRNDRVLVLRAKSTMRFQTSDPEHIVLSYNGAPSKPLLSTSLMVLRGNDPTLILPTKDAETIKEPFPGQGSIKGATVPPPKQSTPISTESP